MTDANPYIVPKEPGRWRALTLAALVHAALLAFLWIGVHWQSETPATIEAEVWNPQPREAAPVPEPVKAPEPMPQSIIKEVPKPPVVEPPVVKPDIALEQEKKRKALEEKEKKRQDDERLAKEKKRELEEKRRLEEDKLAKLKLKEEEAKRAEKEQAEKSKKEAAEKKRKQDEADAKLMAKMREEDMRRMTGTGGTGDAEKSQGGRASAAYGGKVGAKIKSNTIYNVPDDVNGNPPVEYIIELLPDGSLRGTPRKIRSSGIPGFDEAVLRAIDKSQPFPRDEKTGTVPSSLTVSHKPKD